jgi:hypothetical protein
MDRSTGILLLAGGAVLTVITFISYELLIPPNASDMPFPSIACCLGPIAMVAGAFVPDGIQAKTSS